MPWAFTRFIGRCSRHPVYTGGLCHGEGNDPEQFAPACVRLFCLTCSCGSLGLIGLRVDGIRGALVEVNSETDFVARNAKFQEFVEKALVVALERAKETAEGTSATRELDVDELLQSEHPGAAIIVGT